MDGSAVNIVARHDRFFAVGREIRCDRPLVMGILNVTPDSFADKGAYYDRKTAVVRGLEIEREIESFAT